MKTPIMVITPQAGSVTLYPYEGSSLVRIDWHDASPKAASPVEILNLEYGRACAKAWLIHEGWISFAAGSLAIDQETTDYIRSI